MKVRDESVVLGNTTTPNAWGTAYFVYAYPIGAVVDVGAGPQTSTDILVHSGHSFAVGDRPLLWRPGVDPAILPAVTVVDPGGRQITLSQLTQLFPGDRLVNLGPESGANPSQPTYDQSKVTIYVDPDGDQAIGNSRVSVGPYGQYLYYHNEDGWWELLIDHNQKLVSVKEIGTVVPAP